jgi:hypothetical protein
LGLLGDLKNGGGALRSIGLAIGGELTALGKDALAATVEQQVTDFCKPLVAGMRAQLVELIADPMPPTFAENLREAGYAVTDENAAALWVVVIQSIAEQPASPAGVRA